MCMVKRSRSQRLDALLKRETNLSGTFLVSSKGNVENRSDFKLKLLNHDFSVTGWAGLLFNRILSHFTN